ncbi:hypothetical protein COCOBI_18-2500 [Coccomyxa sp. Obi]|nr:hypothetical protein COCOBI_18-2500 [Coccomyxa sp. Obi]
MFSAPHLPDECWLRILSFVPLEHLRCNVALVCKRWHSALSHPKPHVKLYGDVKVNYAAKEFAEESAGTEIASWIHQRLPGVRKIKFYRDHASADHELSQEAAGNFFRKVLPEISSQLLANTVEVELEVLKVANSVVQMATSSVKAGDAMRIGTS